MKGKQKLELYQTTAEFCFRALISQLSAYNCDDHVFISFSAIQIYDLEYLQLHSSRTTGTLGTHNVTNF